MTITTLREELKQLRTYVLDGDRGRALAAIDQVLEVVQPDQLLTTTQAAELLGIGSVNTLKLLVRREGLAYETHGNRMMIPLRELERLQGTAIVRGIQESDRAHNATAYLDGELSPSELETLEADRPGTLPWERDQ